MKKKILDEARFHYRHPAGGQLFGVCHLRAYAEPDKQTVVIATEIAANDGASITNFAEHVAMAAWRAIGRPGRTPEAGMVYVEHCGPASYPDGDRETEFSIVRFTESADGERLSAPAWTHLKPEVIRQLIGDEAYARDFGEERAAATIGAGA